MRLVDDLRRGLQHGLIAVIALAALLLIAFAATAALAALAIVVGFLVDTALEIWRDLG